MIINLEFLIVVLFGIKGVLFNLNKKLVLVYILLNFLFLKLVLKLLGFERKKNLIFKFVIN